MCYYDLTEHKTDDKAGLLNFAPWSNQIWGKKEKEKQDGNGKNANLRLQYETSQCRAGSYYDTVAMSIFYSSCDSKKFRYNFLSPFCFSPRLVCKY